MMKYDYKSLMSTKRERISSVNRESAINEFYSDKSRIIYCSAFRRLQQKAQVFSLEPNASVRTRLTHSLEVSDLGRTIANRIGNILLRENIISVRNVPCIVSIVENACLLHDIGNPPFGHFGETAIKEWAKTCIDTALPSNIDQNDLLLLLIKDFQEFDGNSQGFRTVTKLYTEHDKHSLNLTYATLLCCLKYARAAGEDKGEGILKKAGYFQSEKKVVEKIWNTVGVAPHHRYPLTYLMEAADDTQVFEKHKTGKTKQFSQKQFEAELAEILDEKVIPHDKFGMLLDIFTESVNEGAAYSQSRSRVRVLRSRKIPGADETGYFVSSAAYAQLPNFFIHQIWQCKVNTEDNSFFRFYPLVQNKQIEIMSLLRFMELLGLATYEIRGGEKAEVFIRINDPEKLERLATSGKYTNGVLQSIQEHHRNNERLLTAFFASDMNDDERWELIEQYFLGNEEYVRRILHIAD